MHELLALGALPDRRDEVWLDGGDADLFRVELSDGVPHDYSGDGTNDSIQYTQRVVSARPLLAGVYRTNYNNRHVDFVLCDGYAPRYEWTVTVTAPEGTLHEAFFDPVTISARQWAPTPPTASSSPPPSPSAKPSHPGSPASSGRTTRPSSPSAPTYPWRDHALDFIELGGSVSLTLRD